MLYPGRAKFLSLVQHACTALVGVSLLEEVDTQSGVSRVSASGLWGWGYLKTVEHGELSEYL